MSAVAIHEAVSARFQTLFWADYPAIDVEFSGLQISGSLPLLTSALAAAAKPDPDPTDVAGTAWVRQTLLPISKDTATFTDDRELEMAIYDVFTAWGGGQGESDTMLDSIDSYYNRVTASDVIYVAPDGVGSSRSWLGRTSDGWLHQQIRVPIQYFGTAGEAQIVASPLLTQVAHGFSAEDVIGISAGVYAKALAGTIAPLGICDAAPTVDTFRATFGGLMAAATHGFTLGAELYISTSTAGLLTETATTTAGERKQRVARVATTNQLNVDIEPWEDL